MKGSSSLCVLPPMSSLKVSIEARQLHVHPLTLEVHRLLKKQLICVV